MKSLLAVSFVLATIAVSSARADTLVRYMSTSHSGHSVQTWMYADSSNRLWMDAVVTTGNLNGTTCAEFFHNIDEEGHRSGELLSSCLANTTKYVEPFYLWDQDGTHVYRGDIIDPAKKGLTFCLTDQRGSDRRWGYQCHKPTVSWWYNGAWKTAKTFDQPSPEQYSLANYNDMLNELDTQNLRWLGGSHWSVKLEGSDLVVGAGSSWSSYYGWPWGHNRYLIVFQSDGNLVAYKVQSSAGSMVAVWASGTYAPGATLRIQADGNLVIDPVGPDPCAWNSGTFGLGIDRFENGHNGRLYGRTPGGAWHLVGGSSC